MASSSIASAPIGTSSFIKGGEGMHEVGSHANLFLDTFYERADHSVYFSGFHSFIGDGQSYIKSVDSLVDLVFRNS